MGYTLVSDKRYTPRTPSTDTTEVVAEFCSTPGAQVVSYVTEKAISVGDRIRDQLTRIKIEVDRNPSAAECKRVFGVSVADRYRVTLNYAGKPEKETSGTLGGVNGVGGVRTQVRGIGVTFLPGVHIPAEDLSAEPGLRLGPLASSPQAPGGELPSPVPSTITMLDPSTFYAGPDVVEDSEIGPVLPSSTRLQARTPDGAKIRADGVDVPQVTRVEPAAAPGRLDLPPGQEVGFVFVIGLVPVLVVLGAIAGLFFLLGILVYHIIRKGVVGASAMLVGAAVIGVGIFLWLRGRKQARAPARSNPHRHRHTAACRQNP